MYAELEENGIIANRGTAGMLKNTNLIEIPYGGSRAEILLKGMKYCRTKEELTTAE